MAARSPRTSDTQSWIRAVVRSGVGSASELRERITEAIRADHPHLDADAWASRWTTQAMAGWVADSGRWPDRTDYDKLQTAFGVLREARVAVLEACPDHWSARDFATAHAPVGIVWFTEPDIWHAVEHGMLEVNLWHGSMANAAPGDELLEDVLAAFAAAGLEAHFDEGRIEVSAYWQRRPSR